MDNPSPARHFNRPIEHLSTARAHALRCRFDIVNIEIVKPEGKRHCVEGLLDMAPIVSPCGREPLIWAGRPSVGVLFFPVEKLVVENEGRLPVRGEQLVPAHASRGVSAQGTALGSVAAP